MVIEEFADVCGFLIEITRYPNQEDRWTAKFVNVEVMDGAMLVGLYGNGKSPERAIADYWKQLKGKRIVHRAYSDSRREFVVPE